MSTAAHQAVETEALRRTVLQNVSARRAQRLRAAAANELQFRGERDARRSRDRTTAAPASPPAPPAPQPDVPTWEQERPSVFEAVTALRTLCETLADQVAELRHAQTRELGMLGAWRALKQWGDEECTRIEAAGRSCDDEGKKEEPFEIPPLHSLRQ